MLVESITPGPSQLKSGVLVTLPDGVREQVRVTLFPATVEEGETIREMLTEVNKKSLSMLTVRDYTYVE